MEKTLKVRFLEAVRDALMLELAEQRAKDPTVNQASKQFYVVGLLEQLGATRAEVLMNQGKGYTFVRVNATDGGFCDDYVFGPRRAMTQEMYDSIGDLNLTEAKAVAGIYVDEEGGIHTSFKWDKLLTTAGEIVTPDGAVRKWHDDTQEYDAPICAAPANE